MALRLLVDQKQNLACMYCTTSDWAFGPVGEPERLQQFVEWLGEDARGLPAHWLEAEWGVFCARFPTKEEATACQTCLDS
jgi:hypothetical protein